MFPSIPLGRSLVKMYACICFLRLLQPTWPAWFRPRSVPRRSQLANQRRTGPQLSPWCVPPREFSAMPRAIASCTLDVARESCWERSGGGSPHDCVSFLLCTFVHRKTLHEDTRVLDQRECTGIYVYIVWEVRGLGGRNEKIKNIWSVIASTNPTYRRVQVSNMPCRYMRGQNILHAQSHKDIGHVLHTLYKVWLGCTISCNDGNKLISPRSTFIFTLWDNIYDSKVRTGKMARAPAVKQSQLRFWWWRSVPVPIETAHLVAKLRACVSQSLWSKIWQNRPLLDTNVYVEKFQSHLVHIRHNIMISSSTRWLISDQASAQGCNVHSKMSEWWRNRAVWCTCGSDSAVMLVIMNLTWVKDSSNSCVTSLRVFAECYFQYSHALTHYIVWHDTLTTTK